jgi:2,3-bisphosphoglycerate-independent phosphoglycerate mutase
MRILFLFVDGVGLGDNDANTNPFVTANMPTIMRLTGGKRWLKDTPRYESDESVFIPTDAQIGIEGRPQSGSSQATILTGKNVAQIIGRHYGPKPDAQTRDILDDNNLFTALRKNDKKVALVDGYPPDLLARIARGKTLPSSIQQAAIASGQELFTIDDIVAERAITAEWTGEEWHTHLKLTDVPMYTPFEAGQVLARIAKTYDFAFHSHWLTDYIGHRGSLEAGQSLLERLDGVVAGVLSVWDTEKDLVIITSDHGNMEVIGSRLHTENKVPTLIIGQQWRKIGDNFENLSQFYARILGALVD